MNLNTDTDRERECGSDIKTTDSTSNSLYDSISSNDYETESDTSASFSCNGDINEYRQLATIIVDNLLSKAISKASEEIAYNLSKESHSHHKLNINHIDFDTSGPTIQIDLVGTRTPSPVEDQIEFDWKANRKHYKFTNASNADYGSTGNETDFSFNDFDISDKDDYFHNSRQSPHNSLENLVHSEIRAFAKEYISNIITSALELAVQKSCAKTYNENRNSIHISRSDHSIGPWYIRWRQVMSRLMRSACFCKNKQNFRQRKT